MCNMPKCKLLYMQSRLLFKWNQLCYSSQLCTIISQPYFNKCNLCGNGAINAPEVCDDGNFLDMDGCTNCAIDTGFTCSGAPSVCLPKCGNSVLDAGEQCDTGSKIVNGCK